MKSKSTSFDVRHIAHLARIALSPEEIDTFQSQLSTILNHIEQLKAVDVSQVEPTNYAQPVFNVLRKDEVTKSLDRDVALSNAPQSANGLIIVTKVVE